MPSQFPFYACRRLRCDIVWCHPIVPLYEFVYLEFPEENPTIDDIKQYYSIGENLETNCTSNSSIPPAKLEWWINDMPIYNAEYTIKYNTVVDPVTNRETSILGLRLPLTNEHFYRARVKVSKSYILV